MNSAELRELADACEKATGPDRELDCLIYEADALRQTSVRLNLTPKMRGTYYGEPTGRYFDISGNEPVELPYEAPRYTASLDAAMTLVPEDTRWTLGNMRSPRTVAVVNSFDQGSGANPALALCAAALRAKAQEADRG